MSLYVTITLDKKLIEKQKMDSDEITIGRDSTNDICINNLAVSRFHAKIFKDGKKIKLEDLNSSNGTYKNGENITTSEISQFDDIFIGKYKINIENEIKSDNSSAYIEDSTVIVDESTREKLLKKMGYDSKEQHPSVNSNNSPRLIISDEIEIPIEKELFVLGNSIESDVYLESFFIKKRHATIFKQLDGKHVIMNNSSFFNRTKINGIKIDQQTLSNGDVIEIGKYKMLYLS
ncbi:MAG: FHA domain-containing protein [Candidatus Dadabacteria bacterium]|nr:FHA domain-containing protein [Candidatus Dadabacteria bacterium]NIQ14843.1 FHA domain-containing protein [Candidatus Dadabacteria bacterium]